MKQEQNYIQAEEERFYRATNNMITSAVSEMPKRSKLTNQIVFTVKLECLLLSMKEIQESYRCGVDGRYLS